MLLAIDPGKEGLAVSLFEEGRYLRGAVFALPKGSLGAQCMQARYLVTQWLDGAFVSDSVVEEMVYYPQAGSAKVSSEIAALLRLQAVGAFVVRGNPTYYPARTWKAQLPKEVCHERIAKILDAEELERLKADAARYGKKAHNLWDSVGIGLFHVGRFRP